MALSSKKIRNIVSGFVMLVSLGLVLAWGAGRLLTCAYQAAGDAALSLGIASVLPSLPGALFEDPFYIEFSNSAVALVCLLLFASPLLLGFAQISFGMKLANEDTGREHGDDRLATDREAAALLDKKNPKNNIFFSHISGLAIHAYDKRTRALTEGLNLNHLCVGISGQGKTYNMVMSELFSAIGDALPYKKYGIRNLLRRIFNLLPFRIIRAILGFPLRVLRIRRQNKQPGSVSTLKHHLADRAQATSSKNENKRVENTQALSSTRLSSFSQALAEAISNVTPKRESRAERRKKQQRALAQINAGYDVINSDPKGENVKNTGWMFEKAGFTVKVFNTIDFNGLHFNPLAYIPERRTDSVPIEHVVCSITGNLHFPHAFSPRGSVIQIDQKFRANERKDLGCAIEAHGRKEIGLTCDLRLRRKVYRYDDIQATNMSTKKLGEALEKGDLSDAQREALFLQRELKHIEESIGGYQKTERGAVRNTECKRVVETLKKISYCRSYGTLFIELKNFASLKLGGNLRINLGRSLELVGKPEATGSGNIPEITCVRPDDPNNHHGSLILDVRFSEISEAQRDGFPSNIALRVPVAIVSQRVADGIMLTKVVDVLVSNLHDTDAKSSGVANAEFWEETKRLELMAIIAYLFERYPAKYRTLPNMFRLLNLATPPEDGAQGTKTPLDILMDEWQYGRKAEVVAYDNKRHVRGEGPSMHWVATESPPHDINTSIALHCHLAIKRTASDTYKSVIITCKAALMNLIADDVQEFLSDDEMALDTLGDPDQKQVIFLISQDTDSPYDFITALFVQLALDLALERAFRCGGKLERHVRFVLDEVANIGKIPILIRALAVVRSRNISISMFAQSRSQLFKVYSREEADILFDNCSTISYLGAQSKETLEDISLRIGKETVYSRVFTRQFEGGWHGTRASENIQATSREVRSPSQLRRLCQGTIIVMIFGRYAILDKKFQTFKHGLYPYVYPGSERTLMQPACVCEPYDYAKKIRSARKREEVS